MPTRPLEAFLTLLLAQPHLNVTGLRVRPVLLIYTALLQRSVLRLLHSDVFILRTWWPSLEMQCF